MSHRPPYVHLTPEEYRRLASDNGLCVEHLTWELKTWDFGSRRGFVDWAKVTFDEWTNGIPENQRLAFIEDVLDSYGRIDGRKGGDFAIFRFYQLEAVLRVV